MRKKLTPGEKMVWAQAYAASRSKEVRNPPSHVLKPSMTEARRKYELDAAASACESAYCAVNALRRVTAGSRLEDGYGQFDEVTLMAEEMVAP